MINFEMYVDEWEEIKATTFNPNSTFIMDCPFSTLTSIVGDYLKRIDDMQQQFEHNVALSEYLTNVYNELEPVFRHLKEGGLVTRSCRNEIRCTMKDTERMIFACSVDGLVNS